MAATLTRQRSGVPSTNGHRHPPSAALKTGQRNRARIAVGLVVIVLCVLASATLYASAGDRVAVLSVRRSVPAGRQITVGDLTVASIATGSGLATVPSTDRGRIVGRVAVGALVAGSLLSPEQVRAGPRVPEGMASAGATLKPGQYPVGLEAGDKVLLIETASPAATGTATAPIARGEATVLDLAEPVDATGAVTVSVVVPAESATKVASAGAAGRLSLVVVGGS